MLTQSHVPRLEMHVLNETHEGYSWLNTFVKCLDSVLGYDAQWKRT
jgi:hypothetical protein